MKLRSILSLGLFHCALTTIKVNALPIQQHVFVPSPSVQENTIEAQEYSIYYSIVEHYEDLVDTALSSESEELLIDLIHLPKESMESKLTLQAESMGFKTLSDKQLSKMPFLIGKHVQAMNTHVYESIDSIVDQYWPAVWDKKLLQADPNQEQLLRFLTLFNSNVAKKLIDQVGDYNLLEKVKQDMLALHEEQEPSWLHRLGNSAKMFLSTEDVVTEQDSDFLRQHITDVCTNLLIELHMQFMGFFSKIHSDITGEFISYYED